MAITRKKAAKKTGAHQHRVPGMEKPKKTASIGSLVKKIKKKTPTGSKKSEKPVIVLEGMASSLLSLQVVNGQLKSLEGKKEQLEAELHPVLEEKRREVSKTAGRYIGSVKVQATPGEDEEDIDAGQASYWVTSRYVECDPEAPSTDEEVQEQYDGEATIRDEMVIALATEFEEEDMDVEEASSFLDDNCDVTYNIALAEGALKNPRVLEVLEELSDFLVCKVRMKPSKAFHEASSYDERAERAMSALNDLGLFKPYKASLRPSGAPRG